MRIAVLFEDRCKPNSPAFEYLKKYAGSCRAESIQVDENDKCKILEDACPPCLTRAKNCPGAAVKVINLPEELETDMIHRYSLNGFRLFRLPTPSKDSIIGILGPKLSELIEADGIVMTAEMEIAKLVESQLGINITVDEDI